MDYDFKQIPRREVTRFVYDGCYFNGCNLSFTRSSTKRLMDKGVPRAKVLIDTAQSTFLVVPTSEEGAHKLSGFPNDKQLRITLADKRNPISGMDKGRYLFIGEHEDGYLFAKKQ